MSQSSELTCESGSGGQVERSVHLRVVGVHQLQRIDEWLDNASILHCPHNLGGQRLRWRPHATRPSWGRHAGRQQRAHQVNEGLDLRPQTPSVVAPHVIAVRGCSCCCGEKSIKR